MVETCDICGAKIAPNANYCGQCCVDLREERTPYAPPKKRKTTKKKVEKSDGEKDKPIKWCEIYGLTRSYQLTLPYFVIFVLLLAEGKDLGFCNCAMCDQGYREWLSTLVNLKDKKKTTPSSREIVIKARETDIPSVRINVSEVIGPVKNTKSTSESVNKVAEIKNKVSIEIDQEILENIVFKLLSSDKGKDLVHSCMDRDE